MQGVKSEISVVANITKIAVINPTTSVKISKSTSGNRVVIQGSYFGADTTNTAVELFADGATFRATTVVTTKENEIVADTAADTSGDSLVCMPLH